jgi:hypothetical protein
MYLSIFFLVYYFPGIISVDVFGFEAIVQPDGFIPPGKNQGAITFIDMRNYNNPVEHIKIPRQQFFYHGAQWHDMDNDGDIDMITNRARYDTDQG